MNTVYDQQDLFEFSQRFPYRSRRRDDGNHYGDGFLHQPKTRKRVRMSVRENEETAPVVAAKREIMVGNSDEVLEYYAQQFKNLQQTACKLIAKAWVKQVEPKKQSVHPYTGADDKAPDWWPKPWGPTRSEKVRHKEPDHLYKKERVHLLCHILRLVVEPNDNQHMDIRALNLNVTKLRDSAQEALTSFFAEKDGNNKAKKAFLDYLFVMARSEERYKRGEIDPQTKVFVLREENPPSDNYGDEGDKMPVKVEEDRRISPTKTATRIPGGLSAMSHGQSPARSNMAGPPFVPGEIPAREAPYAHASMPSDQSSFIPEDGNLSQVTIPPAPHESARRGSVFQSPAEYQSHSNPTGMYPAWPGGTTTPNTTQPPYAFTPTTPNHQDPFVPQSLQSPRASYMAQSVELPRSYDTSHGNIFGVGSFTQPSAVVPPPTPTTDYSNFPLDPRSVSAAEVKVDRVPRGQTMG